MGLGLYAIVHSSPFTLISAQFEHSVGSVCFVRTIDNKGISMARTKHTLPTECSKRAEIRSMYVLYSYSYPDAIYTRMRAQTRLVIFEPDSYGGNFKKYTSLFQPVWQIN